MDERLLNLLGLHVEDWGYYVIFVGAGHANLTRTQRLEAALGGPGQAGQVVGILRLWPGRRRLARRLFCRRIAATVVP